jgi:hypothetical protein
MAARLTTRDYYENAIPRRIVRRITPGQLMKRTLWTLFVLVLTIGASSASDDRLGFCTHFDQQGSSPNWNPKSVIPDIAATKAAWIRDDWNWSVVKHIPVSILCRPVNRRGWMRLMRTEVVAVLNDPPSFYPWSASTSAKRFERLMLTNTSSLTPVSIFRTAKARSLVGKVSDSPIFGELAIATS